MVIHHSWTAHITYCSLYRTTDWINLPALKSRVYSRSLFYLPHEKWGANRYIRSHSFVSAGLNQQLIVFLALIILPSLGLVIYGWMKSPKVNGEEDLLSREFWLFVGSISILSVRCSDCHYDIFSCYQQNSGHRIFNSQIPKNGITIHRLCSAF